MSQDPVFQLKEVPTEFYHDEPEWVVGKWYFYDETWANAYGPYDTEEEARRELTRYAEQL